MEVKLIVVRIDPGQVILLTPDKTSLIWPRALLPDKLIVGQGLLFNISRTTEASPLTRGNDLDLINELLRVD